MNAQPTEMALKKLGRPRKADNDLCTERAQIALTKQQKQQWTAKAEECGCSLSRFICNSMDLYLANFDLVNTTLKVYETQLALNNAIAEQSRIFEHSAAMQSRPSAPPALTAPFESTSPGV